MIELIILIVLIVLIVGFFFLVAFMSHGDYYRGVYVPKLAKQRQFARRRKVGPGCHVGPGMSCAACLLYDKCYALIVETVKRDIDEALSQLRGTINDGGTNG